MEWYELLSMGSSVGKRESRWKGRLRGMTKGMGMLPMIPKVSEKGRERGLTVPAGESKRPALERVTVVRNDLYFDDVRLVPSQRSIWLGNGGIREVFLEGMARAKAWAQRGLWLGVSPFRDAVSKRVGEVME